MFLAGLVATVLAGGWITGRWLAVPLPLERWHPGYQLPTVAGACWPPPAAPRSVTAAWPW